MTASVMDRHLDDGAIVRLLDGEAAPAERESADAHLAGCAHCSGRLGALRRRSERLARTLVAADWPCPAMRAPQPAPRPRPAAAPAGPPAWRIRRVPVAAAAAVLLVAAVVVASPARVWLADWTAAGWSRLIGAPRDEPAPDAPAPTRTRVRFEPVGAELSLDFAAHQGTGAVTVRALDVPYVAAEVIAGDTTAGLLVLPAGIRILNRAGAAAEYRVTVPARLERVRVRIAGRDAAVLDADQLARGVRIPLAPQP